MKDRYFSTEECTNRLVRDFYKHDNIIIAVDFDNTLYDFMERGASTSVRRLIRELTLKKPAEIPEYKVDKRFTIILFTAREGEKLKEATQWCSDNFMRIDYVNESPVMSETRKPFYNILLDDKAGLGQAYEVLTNFLKIIDYEGNS